MLTNVGDASEISFRGWHSTHFPDWRTIQSGGSEGRDGYTGSLGTSDMYHNQYIADYYSGYIIEYRQTSYKH